MQTQFSAMRANMIEGQLRPNKVNDRAVLARFAAVAREDFADSAARSSAYIDQPTPLGNGREMYESRVTARLIQELNLTAESKVLVLAGGTGYSAAIMAGLASHITLVEEDSALRAVAEKLLKDEGNITIVSGSPAAFAPQETFDAIIVDAPFVQIPNMSVLVQHLVEGGKLAGVRVQASGVSSAIALTKHGKSLVEEELFDTKGASLPAYAVPEAFVF